MRAIQVTATGGPEVLVPTELPDPSPGPGQVLVEIVACGVNFIDTYQRSGQYPMTLPFVPGSEGAGVVRSVGDGADPALVGTRVAWATANGSYAELVVVDATQAVAVPDAVSDAEAASVLLQGLTAQYLLTSTYAVQPGDTVLVHAGAGGTGLVLTQLAVARGARVLTTVSSDAKAELSVAAGATEVLRYDDDVAARVRELTGGEGVAAVYDGVGATTFETSLASLRVRGTLALFGAASGPVPPFDPQRLNGAGSLFLTRPTLAHHVRTPEELHRRAGEVLTAVAEGSLRLRVGASFPLADAAAAHTALQARETTGSVVLVP